MNENLTIGVASQRSGVSVATIRFYETKGIIPAPRRTDAGYRLFAPNDVRRLRLVHRARLLGLGLPEIAVLAQRAFASECGDYAREVVKVAREQRAKIDRRISELQALREDLDALEREARSAADAAQPGLTVAECPRCLLADDETSGAGYCNCGTGPQPITLEPVTTGLVDGLPDAETLETLACEVGRRPRGAPTVADILPAVTQVWRDDGALVIEFDPVAADTVAGFVEAERHCCSTLAWSLVPEPTPRLRITGTRFQVDALAETFAGVASR